MHTDKISPRTRRYLSADGLIKRLRERFETIEDTRRQASIGFPLADCLMAGFAMFSLKDPSLLAFEKRWSEQNLQNLYRIEKVPSDTQMRDILDPIELDALHECFADIFYELQRGGVLKRYEFVDGNYLLAIDGTGYFSSSNIRCPNCLEHRDRSGNTKYAHQMVAAVLVHPDHREVIPLAIEPIVKQDGETKNDCERNATQRLLERVRKQHPKLKLTVVEDGLSSNAPHIHDLERLGFSYLLGAKPGDHEHLFEQVITAGDEDRLFHLAGAVGKGKNRRTTGTHWTKDLSLNASNLDLRVNFLEHHEFDADGEVAKRFSWVTDLPVSSRNAERLVKGGRCRWRIENETFNTLKNQGYHFEHNYGHGKQNLSTVLAVLMMLAFLVDQVQQACCPLFTAVLEKLGSRRELWDNLRSHFRHFNFRSLEQLYRAILTDSCKNRPPPSEAW